MATINTPEYPEWVPGIEIDHVTAARTHLQAMFPEAALAPASVEMTVLEAQAVMAGPVALAFQKAPAQVVEHLMGLYGLYRSPGQRAFGKAKFLLSSGQGTVTIPSGTLLRYNVDDYVGSLDFVTTEQLNIITSESLEGEVHLEATENGTAHNGVPAGARLDTLDWMMQVESVEMSQTTRAGENAETDTSFEERAMAMLARQSSALVYAEQFESAALTRPEVGRAFAVNNWDAATSTAKTGHVSVAVTDITGQSLPPSDRDGIQEMLQAQVISSLSVHVINPTYTTVNMSVTVEAAPGTNYADVQAAVIAALTARLNPRTWSWWNTITNLDIASWIDDVAGVARVVSVPTGITLSGVAPLPVPGTINATVNPPTR